MPDYDSQRAEVTRVETTTGDQRQGGRAQEQILPGSVVVPGVIPELSRGRTPRQESPVRSFDMRLTATFPTRRAILQDHLAAAGYRDCNYSLLYNGIIVELQVQIRSFAVIKEEAHVAYGVARSLGLAGELPEDRKVASQSWERAVACSLSERLVIYCLRFATASFATLVSGRYIFFGAILEDEIEGEW